MTTNRSIRVGAAGIVLDGSNVLLVKFDDENGVHYNFPGGGHDEGETLRQTAAREVKEETDADVEVGRLLVVAESVPSEVDYVYGTTHFLKFFFECKLKPGSAPRMPDKPDPNEIAVEWVPLNDIGDPPAIPAISNEIIQALQTGETTYFEDDGVAAKELNLK